MQTTRNRPGVTRFGALRLVDPARWRTEIEEALRATDGRVPAAAERLGVATRTLYLALQSMRAA